MMSGMSISTAEEKKYRAENDAYIISQYLEIMKDEERVKLASEFASKQVENIEKQLSAMKEVAKKGKK